MSIYEIMDLCLEPGLCTVVVFDTEKGEEVWSGAGDEIPRKYADKECDSFDVPEDGKMTFNIS